MLSRFTLLIITLCTIGFVPTACQNKQQAASGSQDPAPQLLQSEKSSVKIPFKPPADTAITSAQLQQWTNCNPLLDSLTIFYQDSFKTKSTEKLLKYQQDFLMAQDKICVLAGLSGGYEEYLWVLKNMGNPKNKPLCESFNLKTF